ncbi:MAG: oligosaccharide flippase family protein [Parcubacteria group bacterium]
MIKKLKNKVYTLSKEWGSRIGLDLPYFVKNGFWVAIRQGIGMVSGLALSIAFARLATQEVFGQYQFILSVLSIVSILSIPGLNTSITQSVARGYDGDYERVVKTSFLWSLLGIPTLLIIGGYYYVFQNHSLGIAFMIASIFFPFFYAPNTWDAFFQGKSRFDVAAKYSSIQAIINAVATIVIIFFSSESLIAIIIVYLVSYTFFNGYCYFKSLKYIENEKKDKDTLKYGWFLTKIGILNIIANNIDKIMVGVFLSQSQLAIYSIGIMVSKQIQNITKSLLGITVPKQIKQGHVSKNNYLKVFLIACVISVSIWVSAPLLMDVLFSDRYAESIYLTRLSSLFYPVFVISILYKNKFIFNRNEKIIKIESVVAPLIKITLIFALLPFFGVAGLAFLFGFQYIISIIVLHLVDSRRG